MRQEVDRERRKRESEVDRERRARENEIRRMREQSERERMEKENAIQLMLYEVNQKEEQLERERNEKDRELADLRNKLSQASLMTPPQVKQKSFFKQLLFYHETKFSDEQIKKDNYLNISLILLILFYLFEMVQY